MPQRSEGHRSANRGDLPWEKSGTPRPTVGSPMGQGEHNCCPAENLMNGTRDIVQPVRRVIERVARESENGGDACNTHARHAFDHLRPSVADVLRRDPTQKEYGSNGDPTVNPEDQRGPGMLSEVRPLREEI